jgi:hypothetical protein
MVKKYFLALQACFRVGEKYSRSFKCEDKTRKMTKLNFKKNLILKDKTKKRYIYQKKNNPKKMVKLTGQTC